MGKKYIVELGRCERLYKALIDGNGKPELAWLSPEIDLTPYTEPDLEQVRKEAYEEGKKQAKVQAELDVCHDIEKVAKENYKAGLADAWEAARKIACDEGIDMNTLCTIFRRGSSVSIIRDYSASEAIAKIKEYEDGKQEIKVGDEVVGIFSDGSETRPFVFIRGSKEYYFGLYSDTGEFCQGGMNMRKTGRHFSEIATVLEKMRGEQK